MALWLSFIDLVGSVEPTYNLHARVRWHNIQDLIGEDGPYKLIENSDFCEIAWYPRAGADDAPVMLLTADRTDEAKEAGMGNRILRPYVPFDTDAVAQQAIEEMEESVCSGEGLGGWEKLNSGLVRFLYPPLENRDGLSAANVAQVVDDALGSDVVSNYLQAVPSIFSGLAGGLVRSFDVVAKVLAWSSTSTEVDGVASWEHNKNQERQ